MDNYKSDNLERLKELQKDLQFSLEDTNCMKKICETVEKISALLDKPRIDKKAIKLELMSLAAEMKKKTLPWLKITDGTNTLD